MNNLKIITLALENVSLDEVTRVMILDVIGDTLPVYTILILRFEWDNQGGE